MRQPSGRTSRILSVTPKKKGVEIVLEKKTFLVSSSFYSDNFFYPGKTLSKEELEKLNEENRLYKAETYLALLLSSHRLTVQGTKEKLERFHLEEKEKERLLEPYLQSHVLDDLSYCLDYIEDRKRLHYGKMAILASLKKKGIKEDILKSPEVQSLFQEEEIDSIFLKRLFLKDKDKPLLEKKKKILDTLQRRGYSREKALQAIDKYLGENPIDEEDEKEKRLARLRVLAQRCYNQLQLSKREPKEKERLYRERLLRKGFRLEEIQTIQQERHDTFK